MNLCSESWKVSYGCFVSNIIHGLLLIMWLCYIIWQDAHSPDGVVSAGLGPLHYWHPLVIITEEGEVEVGTAAVGLGADRQLTQQPTHCLRVPAVFGVHYGVFESEAQTDRDISTVTVNSRIFSSKRQSWHFGLDVRAEIYLLFNHAFA